MKNLKFRKEFYENIINFKGKKSFPADNVNTTTKHLND